MTMDTSMILLTEVIMIFDEHHLRIPLRSILCLICGGIQNIYSEELVN